MKLAFWPNPQGYRNIDLGLTRVYQLLERLDNPHLKLPPTIHIAGTNGKGSTLAFLRSIFTESGLKIHSYTSPHLISFNERIILAGKEIDDNFLTDILNECKNAAEKHPKITVTFFEGITIAAFLAFSRIKADLLLLETGMGGRLDATNVLPQVLCSIITPIALDHSEFLGKTFAKIAYEKSGIIKENCPIFSAKQSKSALNTITKCAANKKAPFLAFNQDWKIKINKNGFIFSGFGKEIALAKPSLQGKHQIDNAALAIAVTLAQKNFKISQENIKSALNKTFWPARLQKITNSKFNKNNREIYLDGGHNLHASRAIFNFLKDKKNKQKYVIFAMLKDKNCFDFLKKIAPQIDQLIAMTITDEPNSLQAVEVKKIAEKLGIESKTAQNFEEAFKICKDDQENLVLLCGSLYFAGEFLETIKK